MITTTSAITGTTLRRIAAVLAKEVESGELAMSGSVVLFRMEQLLGCLAFHVLWRGDELAGRDSFFHGLTLQMFHHRLYREIAHLHWVLQHDPIHGFLLQSVNQQIAGIEGQVLR